MAGLLLFMMIFSCFSPCLCNVCQTGCTRYLEDRGKAAEVSDFWKERGLRWIEARVDNFMKQDVHPDKSSTNVYEAKMLRYGPGAPTFDLLDRGYVSGLRVPRPIELRMIKTREEGRVQCDVSLPEKRNSYFSKKNFGPPKTMVFVGKFEPKDKREQRRAKPNDPLVFYIDPCEKEQTMENKDFSMLTHEDSLDKTRWTRVEQKDNCPAVVVPRVPTQEDGERLDSSFVITVTGLDELKKALGFESVPTIDMEGTQMGSVYSGEEKGLVWTRNGDKCVKHKPERGHTPCYVLYLTPDKLPNFEIDVKDGLLVWKENGELRPVNSVSREISRPREVEACVDPREVPKLQPFEMLFVQFPERMDSLNQVSSRKEQDLYKLYGKKIFVLPASQMGFLQHSSLVGGRNVLTAGAMVVENGKLISINNFSGHYKPSAKSLYLMLLELQKRGVDFSNVKISVMLPEFYFNEAQKRLKNKN